MKKEKKTQEELPQEQEGEQTEVKESKGRKVLSWIVNVILVVAIILAAVCTYVSYVSTSGSGVPSIFGIRMFSIQTESMYPTLLPGDLIFDRGVKDPDALVPGDIITYWTVINGERVLNTHRISEVYDGGGYRIFSTKGDNNSDSDILTVHESEVVGKYAARIPGVGKLLDYLQTSTGFLIVIVVPVFIFFLFHLIQFFRVLFEYQNVKNRLKYEQERGNNEEVLEKERREQEQAQQDARAKMEAELREKLKAEILASMAAEKKQAEAPETVAEESKQEEAPAAEQPAEEAAEEPEEQNSEEKEPEEEKKEAPEDTEEA